MTGTCEAAWTTVAAGWDRNRRHIESMKHTLSAELIAGIKLTDGDRVLELGAGTGEFALRLAEQVAPSGTVIASDVAAGMLELIRRTTSGTPAVEVLDLDASEIALPDASVAGVVFRMGLMLVREPLTALKECHRVLTPNGRLGVAVWAAPEHNPWLTSLGMAAMMHGLVSGGPPTGPGGPFSLSNADVLENLVKEAGFVDLAVREIDTTAVFASTDEHFATVCSLAPPLGAAWATAPEDVRQLVRDTTANLVRQYQRPDGLRVPGRALLCVATRP
jgi:SAM-dependent methyltransferase